MEYKCYSGVSANESLQGLSGLPAKTKAINEFVRSKESAISRYWTKEGKLVFLWPSQKAWLQMVQEKNLFPRFEFHFYFGVLNAKPSKIFKIWRVFFEVDSLNSSFGKGNIIWKRKDFGMRRFSFGAVALQVTLLIVRIFEWLQAIPCWKLNLICAFYLKIFSISSFIILSTVE